MKSLIQSLAEIPGPCGYETKVRAATRAKVELNADELRVDGLGNLIIRKGTRRSGGKRILVLAHLDEPGFIVSHIRSDGLARFMPLGSMRPEILAGSRVRFLNGSPGVIGYAANVENGINELEHLVIDIGAGANPPVKIGEAAVFDAPFVDLGNRIAGKALDNRVGVAVVIETLRKLHENPGASPHEIHFVFGVQELEGARGAGPAAFQIEPELALSVDLTDSGDVLGSAPGLPRLGGGAVIRLRDASMFTPSTVLEWMVDTAEKHGISHQMEITSGETTGARAAQITNRGASAGVLAIPCRYRGSPSEMVDLGDVQAAAELLLGLLTASIKLLD